MDLPIIVSLSRPITLDGQTVTELHFDEPDLNAQIAYAELEAGFAYPPSEADGGRAVRFWIARLADLPEAAAGRIRGADMQAVQGALDAILGAAAREDGAEAAGNGPQAT